LDEFFDHNGHWAEAIKDDNNITLPTETKESIAKSLESEV
jgi:hypothetical protein